MVWVHFLALNFLYYDKCILLVIAKVVGKSVKSLNFICSTCVCFGHVSAKTVSKGLAVLNSNSLVMDVMISSGEVRGRAHISNVHEQI